MYTQFVYVRDHQSEKISALQAKVIQAETRNAAIVAQLAKTKSRSSQFESLKAQNEKLSAGRAQKLTENEQLAAQITALQTKQNRLVEIQKDTDAQIADLSAQRDQQAKSHQETRQQVESLEVENEKLRGDNKQRYELDEQLSHSQQKVSELAAQNAELRASLSKSKQHHAALIIELENQLSGTHKKLVEQQENESAINRELGMVKLTLLENQGKLKELKQQFGELVTQKAELRKQLVHITNELQEQTHLYHENKKWVISLKKQKEQLTVDLESKSRGADLGQKMLSKSHVDLDFLRKSYSEKVHSEEKLVELVKELKVKLTLASQFYFQLQNEHPELLTSLDNVESK
jgi:chromosome segregation ATPase